MSILPQRAELSPVIAMPCQRPFRHQHRPQLGNGTVCRFAKNDETALLSTRIVAADTPISSLPTMAVLRNPWKPFGWGTFEWLVEDAFRLGYCVIVAHSDGHKGHSVPATPVRHCLVPGGLTCF